MSLCFRKWNFLDLILKKFLHFLKRKLFLYFLKRKLFWYFLKKRFSYICRNGTLHFSLLSSRNKKNPLRESCLYFRKRKPWTIWYLSGNWNSKKASYISGGTLQTLIIKKKFTFLYKAAKFSNDKGVFFLLLYHFFLYSTSFCFSSSERFL